MLKSIDKIKRLGVFENYTKPAGTREFASKNLIYGWNYSGKTTLSRLFAKLESKSAHSDFKDCEFTFNGGADAITQNNLDACSFSVRVFNSDFVKNNLSFDSGSCNAILLLGKESEEAQRKIDALFERITRSKQLVKALGKKFDDYTEIIAEEKRQSAQNIRRRLKIDPYNASHLGNDLHVIGLLDSQLLPERELVDSIELALTPDSKKPKEVTELGEAPAIESLYRESMTVLAATPTFSNALLHLEQNPAIERWVETGLHLHPDGGACEFCGNPVSEGRLAAFRSHFSKDLAEHREAVQALLDRVKAAEFTVDLPRVAELNPQFHAAYSVACAPLAGHIKAFNSAISTLIADVSAKLENSRKAIAPSPLTPGLEAAIANTMEAINRVIKENNELAANFVSERAAALKRAKNHFVQEAADRLESNGWERKKEVLTRRTDRLQRFLARAQSEVERLQAEISQAQQGREQINERLRSMLGSDAVQIKVIKDVESRERFQLVRKSGVVAKNLSDGERTAVAFSYFLTKLRELKPEVFKETIVYIDDPISSLDSNHIFQVTAAINDLFLAKITQPNGNEAWGTTCKQLFISTHNFEFFNLMRELKPEGENAARLFLVKRVASGASELCNMPKSLARYGSEYQYLFDRLYQFHKSADKTAHEHLLILPNALRRFVELYTFSRIPSAQKETVDQRAGELFGKERAKAILKFLHTFSHGNTIERVAGNTELIFLLEETVKAVFDELQDHDRRHWNALEAAVDK